MLMNNVCADQKYLLHLMVVKSLLLKSQRLPVSCSESWWGLGWVKDGIPEDSIELRCDLHSFQNSFDALRTNRIWSRHCSTILAASSAYGMLDAKCVPYLKRRGWWHSSTGSSIKASPVQPTAGRPASCFMATLKRRLPDGIPCWQLEKKTFNKLMILSSRRNLKSILARFTVRLTLRLRAWVYHRRYRRPFQRLYKPHL